MPRGVPRVVQTPGQSAEAPESQAAEPVVTAEAEVPEPVATASLRAVDVDPTKIRRAVLTLDGWVCPASSPAPPAKE